MSPLQPGKTAKAAVESNPFATELDRQRGMKSIWHKIAARVACAAEIDKNSPMARSRCQKMHLFPAPEVFEKLKSL